VTSAVDWQGKVVLDMVIRPRWTRLLQDVRRGGGVPVPGVDMWVHQGAAQWALFTGHAVSPQALAELLPPDLGAEADPQP
jgi:shikimate 5-dehydrogenase